MPNASSHINKLLKLIYCLFHKPSLALLCSKADPPLKWVQPPEFQGLEPITAEEPSALGRAVSPAGSLPSTPALPSLKPTLVTALRDPWRGDGSENTSHGGAVPGAGTHLLLRGVGGVSASWGASARGQGSMHSTGSKNCPV